MLQPKLSNLSVELEINLYNKVTESYPPYPMTATQPAISKAFWANAIAHPAKEFAPTSLSVISGHIPPGLRGTLYRNGPGRLERGGIRVGHWFDGDGAILAVRFSDDGAVGSYRYVETAEYLAEAEAGEYLYANYGMTAPGPLWNSWFKPFKNSANTSVFALSDRLLALWEGGKPHALDLKTLRTLEEDSLGSLEGGMTYSAHPKYDAKTDELINFGVTPGLTGTLHLYKSNVKRPSPGHRSGQICQKTAIPLESVSLIHDFALAGRYLVFCIPPVRMNALPALIGLQSFSDALEWKPEKGTKILVIDRETLTLVSQCEVDPWFQWHFANGYEAEDGSIVLDLIRYADFQTNQYLKEVATGNTQTCAKGTLWQIRIDPQTSNVRSAEEMLNRTGEFPIVPPDQVGHDTRYSYLALHRTDVDTTKELLGTIARFDYQTGTLMEADLGHHRYPSEPIYVRDRHNANQAWILTVVFDGNTETSEVWIFDSDRLDDSPVCRLALPTIIPHSFHGTWRSE
jgi:carotenoid cleavage dioxygenase-like enzyme